MLWWRIKSRLPCLGYKSSTRVSAMICHCCLINRTTESSSRFPLDVSGCMPILSRFYRCVNDSCRRFRTTPGPVANVNSRGCNVNLDGIRSWRVPRLAALQFTRPRQSSARYSQFHGIRGSWPGRDSEYARKGTKEREGGGGGEGTSEGVGGRRWPIVELKSAFSLTLRVAIDYLTVHADDERTSGNSSGRRRSNGAIEEILSPKSLTTFTSSAFINPPGYRPHNGALLRARETIRIY